MDTFDLFTDCLEQPVQRAKTAIRRLESCLAQSRSITEEVLSDWDAFHWALSPTPGPSLWWDWGCGTYFYSQPQDLLEAIEAVVQFIEHELNDDGDPHVVAGVWDSQRQVWVPAPWTAESTPWISTSRPFSEIPSTVMGEEQFREVLKHHQARRLKIGSVSPIATKLKRFGKQPKGLTLGG